MQNAFLPHEDDFQVWVDGGFGPCEPETADYLRFLADPEDERKPQKDGLWPHQWQALLRVIYAREVAGRSFWGDGVSSLYLVKACYYICVSLCEARSLANGTSKFLECNITRSLGKCFQW